MTKTIFIIALLAGAFFIGVFCNGRTEALGEWADAYEICVENRYNTTPSNYYSIWGEYPECEIDEQFSYGN